jgi:hypothetical protein
MFSVACFPWFSIDPTTDNSVPIETQSRAALSALNYSDEHLLVLLKDKPKNREELRTERNYKAFFKGMPKSRMHDLLKAAYSTGSSGDVLEVSLAFDQQYIDDKVNKRMNLLREVLVDDGS